MKAKLILLEQPIIEINGIKSSKQIDYNGIDFGVVDVEKLAEERFGSERTNHQSQRFGFIEGAKTIQQLNEKKFTLEELKYAYECGRNHQFNLLSSHTLKETIEYLSLPKTYDIEIEESENTIKILKKI